MEAAMIVMSLQLNWGAKFLHLVFKSFNRVRGRDFPHLKLKVSSPVSLSHVSTAAFVPFISFLFFFCCCLHQKFNTSGFKNLWHQFSACATRHSFRPRPTYCGLLLLWDLLRLPENGCSSIQAVCHCVEQHKQAFTHIKKMCQRGQKAPCEWKKRVSGFNSPHK